MSLNTQRNLETSSNGMNQVLARLSSGLRVNSAKDDAAGLAIGSRMESLIRGDRQAHRNVNDGVSLLQVADGAMTTATNTLQRLRELAVQAANGTLSTTDKDALQAESNQLLSELTRISEQSEFNGKKIFAQSASSIGGDINIRSVIDGLRLGWLEEAETKIKDQFGIIGDGAKLIVNLKTSDGKNGTLASVSGVGGAGGKVDKQYLNIDMADFVPPNLPDGGSEPFYNDRIIAHEMVHAVMGRSMNFVPLPKWFKEGAAELIHGADERIVNDYNGGAGLATILAAFNADDVSASAGYSAGYAALRFMHERIKMAGGEGVKDIMVYLSSNSGSTLDQALTNASSGAFATLAGFNTAFNANAGTFISKMNLTNTDTGAIGGFDADNKAIQNAKDILTDRGTQFSDQPLKGFSIEWPSDISGGAGLQEWSLQIGAERNQTLTVQIGGVSATNLGLGDLDLNKQATLAIAHLDQAIEYVNGERGRVGASMSRLATIGEMLQTSGENLSAARSRIIDTDFAQETASLTRQQILTQAGTAMLAQANNLPSLALQLLR
ncbi:flagellinolysin [Deefgea piscis]|uniref:Flagellin n=2 Tax=Deefgea piscis TaxID=2739061 RepID=A0A6M8SRT5_9NEIS|nr:flagellinolysin [Deefgea piscis]